MGTQFGIALDTLAVENLQSELNRRSLGLSEAVPREANRSREEDKLKNRVGELK